MNENARRVEEGLKELERRSAEAGQPVTIQRRAALEALVRRSDLPMAEAIYADVVAELSGVSKATGYRALDNLVQLGLARKVHHQGSVARYDGNREPHHHLVCWSRGTIQDTAWEVLDAIPVPRLPNDRFEVHDFFISFQCICRDCKKSQSSVAGRSR